MSKIDPTTFLLPFWGAEKPPGAQHTWNLKVTVTAATGARSKVLFNLNHLTNYGWTSKIFESTNYLVKLFL